MHLIRSSTRAHSSHAITTHSENPLKTDARMVASPARRTHLIKIAQRDENHRQWFSIKSTKKKKSEKTKHTIDSIYLLFASAIQQHTELAIANKLTRPKVIQKSILLYALLTLPVWSGRIEHIHIPVHQNPICKYQTSNNIIKIKK